MKFSLKFKADGGAVSMGARYHGLDFLDKVREELDEEIPLKIIDNHTKSLQMDVHIKLNYRQALVSGLFIEKSGVHEVKLSCGQLNEFVSVEVDEFKENGEVTSVKAVLKVNKGQILERFINNQYKGI